MASQNVIDAKKKEVDFLVQNIQKSKLIILFEYQCLKVSDLTELRVELKKINSTIKFYPNNILKRTFKILNQNQLVDLSNNSKALLFGHDDLLTPIKILLNFVKKNKFLKIVIAILENKICSEQTISELSFFSSKEHLLAILSSEMMFSLRELTMGLSILQKQRQNTYN